MNVVFPKLPGGRETPKNEVKITDHGASLSMFPPLPRSTKKESVPVVVAEVVPNRYCKLNCKHKICCHLYSFIL